MIYFCFVKTTFLDLLRGYYTPMCFIRLNNTKHKNFNVQSHLFYYYVVFNIEIN